MRAFLATAIVFLVGNTAFAQSAHAQNVGKTRGVIESYLKEKGILASDGSYSGGGGGGSITINTTSPLAGGDTGTTFTLTLGTVTEAKGGTNQTTWAKGDLLYSSATNTLAKLAGNTTTSKKFLSQTGDGAASAAPSWVVLSASDIPDISATYQSKFGSQSQNFVYSGPTSGSGAPSFRALVAADIPDISATYQPLNARLTTIGGLSRTRGALIVGGASDWTAVSVGTTGKFLGTDGTDAAWHTLSGTTNQVSIANSSGNLTLSTPQDIHSGATPTFSTLTLSGASLTMGGALANASDVWHVSHSTTAQALRLYNTTDSASAPTNAEWLEVSWATNLCTIQTSKSGTGTNRNMTISSNGSGSLQINGSTILMECGGSVAMYLAGNTSTRLRSDSAFGWSSSTAPTGAGNDIQLTRATAGGILSVDGSTPGDALGKIKMGGTTGAGSVGPTWTNFPGVNTGTQNPYTWLRFVATDGTVIYVPAFK